MKKLILITATIIAFTFSTFAQSNSRGTVHIGVYGGGLAGISASKATPGSDNYSEGWQLDLNAKANVGLKASFGIAKRFSAGVFARKEISNYYYSKYTGTAVGLEGKYYPINKERFNLYVGPTIGYSTGNISNRYEDRYNNFTTGVTGYNYSIGAGINWYWTEYLGMSADIGYAATSLSGHIDHPIDLYGDGYADTFDVKIKSYGIYCAVGIITKFGGKK